MRSKLRTDGGLLTTPTQIFNKISWFVHFHDSYYFLFHTS